MAQEKKTIPLNTGWNARTKRWFGYIQPYHHSSDTTFDLVESQDAFGNIDPVGQSIDRILQNLTYIKYQRRDKKIGMQYTIIKLKP